MASTDRPRAAPREADQFIASAAAASASLSSASLARRSRTRTRSRTVTASSQRRGKSAGPSTSGSRKVGHTDEPVPGQRVDGLGAGPTTENTMRSEGEPASIRTTTTYRVTLSDGGVAESTRDETLRGGGSFREQSSNEATPRKRCQSLPRRLSGKPGSSSDSSSQRGPSTPVPLPGTSPIVNTASRDGIRHSIISQHSTSSSVYPASTVSRSDSRSTAQLFTDDDDILTSKMHEFSSFDVDDVSERLRLLVTNSYFLPPAHSKPAISNLAVNSPKVATKPSTPGFLDIFKLGKSRPKPVTPENDASGPVIPILRTTSDSTTASGWFPPQGYSRSAPPSPAPHEYIRQTRESNRIPRVVVVREKMEDLIVAAKEAEQALKTRVDVAQVSLSINDMVDPTDSVDIPHQSGDLTVGGSMDAAILADALVPPMTSPGLWSLDSNEVKWRKALLHEAVGHSLNGRSLSSSVGDSVSPTPTISPVPWSDTSHSPALLNNKVGKPIIDQSRFERDEDQRSKSLRPSKSGSRPTTRHSDRSFTLPVPQLNRTSFQAPGRVETPPIPPAPLAPPPRRPLVNSLYSLSQVDLSTGVVAGPSEAAENKARVVRKSMSTPVLGDVHEHGVDTGRFVLTPPPIPRRSPMRMTISPSLPEDAESRGSSPVSPPNDGARYSDEKPGSTRYATPADSDEMLPRPSVSISISTEGRLSLSEYSQPSPSPTASAFQDALYDARSSTSSIPRISIGSAEDVTLTSYRMRRSESSASRRPSPLRNQAVPPPLPLPFGRAGSSGYPQHTRRQWTYEGSDSATSPTAMQQILAPAPTTPPLPDFGTPATTPQATLSQRRGRISPGPLALDIPLEQSEHPIHSAPVPASPITFFDSIEEQSIALDALDDSSDEEEDNPAQLTNDTHSARIYMDTRTNASSSTFSLSSSQPSIARHGNHSTPYLTPSQASVRSLPVSMAPSFDLERNKPVSNIPPRGTFFSGKKGKKGVGPVSALNYDRRQSVASVASMASSRRSEVQRPGTASTGAHSAGDTGTGRRDESLDLFEGMLTKHLEAERDVMKRIANNVSTSSRQRR